MDLHHRLAEIRRSKKISQGKIAEKLGFSQSALNKIEKGKTELTLKRLFDICNALEINAIEILFPEQVNKTENKKLFNNDTVIESIKLRNDIIKELKNRAEILKNMAEDYKSLYLESQIHIKQLEKELNEYKSL